MATEKYKLPSPYTYEAPPPPKEDEIYYQHISDLKLGTKGSNQVYGVAIFGIGRAGTIHLANLTSLHRVKLLYVVDDETSKLESIKRYYNIDSNATKLITSKDADQIYKDQRVNFVIISSPTYTHEAILEQSLTYGKATFCEKPIAESIEKTKKLFDLAKKMNVPLFSAFNRRFDPSYQNLRNRIRGGEVGKILTVKVCSRDSPLPTIDYLSISGGIFHDCAVHDIDQLLYSLGELPLKISCIANSNIPEIKAIDDFDTVAIIMSFPSGAVGIIDLSRQCCFGYDQRLEVFGEKGMLKVENRSPVGTVEAFTHESIKRAPIDYSFPSRYGEAYKRELLHFIDVLDGNDKLLVTPEVNLAVSKIATAAEESARTGKIISLSWTKEESID
ncbi:uncharacterized oxidoreductase YrbE-like [Euwallacea similis]|uniref:uncharacterized oxidoreductase YrbE-like n=1 Tax=Euwallacea similis TaxID=1736056 RepID=UPI00344FC437